MVLPVSQRSLHRAVRSPAREARLQELRYAVFGRALPSVLFGLLGYRVFLNLVSQVRSLPARPSFLAVASGPLPTALYFLFCAIPVAIYLARPAPQARDGRLLPRLFGLTGTTMLLVVGAFPNPVLFAAPDALRSLATPLTIAAFLVAVSGLLCLRRSLSIIPEARRLVTTGPYRLLRHPLYSAEIAVALALFISRPALWVTVALLPFVAVQMQRARYEEALLRRSFPAYAAYARRTARVIPFVW